MELYQAQDHYIIVNGDYSLWCNRFDSHLTAKKGLDLCSAWNPVCLGQIYGVIGKIQIHPESEWKLLLIRQQQVLGYLPGNHEICKITKIAILPLSVSEPPDLEIELCKKHHFGITKTDRIAQISEQNQKGLQKTWNSLKNAAGQVKPRKKNVRDKEKFEKRVTEELQKMFCDSDSFYYSPTGDLTNTLQRQQCHKKSSVSSLWSTVDDRFFWNKYMLMDLITSEDQLADHWIIPVIQGYIQIEKCFLDFSEETEVEAIKNKSFTVKKEPVSYTITLISRRSRYRAGTRYKRRGIDESGACANYVETEQIIEVSRHIVSFVQVRGSVPLYWSQAGFKYRPPPKLDRGEEETKEAFAKHFDEQLSIYNHLTIISLVEQNGKEKIIADAYLNQLLNYDSSNLTYITFDFHEYCRGMKFENVSILIEKIAEIIKDMRYCWVDSKGVICNQRSVFRVNCIDCLDRTNVVQTALARAVMEIQFRKLGLLPPDEMLPIACRLAYQEMWANNGDAVSRQYAGTAALKGDYTRTGERKLAGLMKDGYNSANRYYLNRFKDAYRQVCIDLMLGNAFTEDLSVLSPSKTDSEDEVSWMLNKDEHVKQLIDDCKKMLVPPTEMILGGWAVIDCDPMSGDPTQQDMDTIVVLSREAYYIANYDDEADRITRYQRILLEDLEKIELGPEPSLFKSKYYCVRLIYKCNNQSGYFHMFRPTNTRFFNNMAVSISSMEEAIESLKAICATFEIALDLQSRQVPFYHGKLERKKSRLPPMQGSGFLTLNVSLGHLVGEGSLVSGSKYISSMYNKFASLNPIKKVHLRKSSSPNRETCSSTNIKVAQEATELEEISLKECSNKEPSLSESSSSIETDSEENFIIEDPIKSLTEESGNFDSDNELEQDVILRSCGILATSHHSHPTLHRISAGELNFVDDYFGVNNTQQIYMDDFILQSLRKTNLKQTSSLRNNSFNVDIHDKEEISKSVPLLKKSTSEKVANKSVETKTKDLKHKNLAIGGSCSGKKSPEIHIDPDVKDISVLKHDAVDETCMNKTISYHGDYLLHSKSSSDFSHSHSNSNHLDNNGSYLDIQIGMKVSHSDSSIKETAKKDWNISTFSKIANRVQNLGMNLTAPRIRSRQCKVPTPTETEHFQRMKEKRKNCQTRIIEI